jgi:hypothetical protein
LALASPQVCPEISTPISSTTTVTMNMEPASTVYVCATEKIYVNGYGGDVYYQGAINDTRRYGNKILV